VVAFLSSDEVVRAYEVDLLGELDRKELGTRKLIVGSRVPSGLATRPEDVIVECGDSLADEDLVLLDVVVGQILAFFRCLHEGLAPTPPPRKASSTAWSGASPSTAAADPPTGASGGIEWGAMNARSRACPGVPSPRRGGG
ncbi:MAG TPA: hypothetical protein VF964_01510, partial [Vicinamibacteria bacterium]